MVLISLAFSVNARETHSLKSTLRKYGFKTKKIKEDKYISCNKKGDTLVFKKQSRLLRYNELLIWMNRGTFQKRKRWYVHTADVKNILDPLLRPVKYINKKAPGKIILDPGHGGKDQGAYSSNGLSEKEVSLKLAKITAEKLQQLGYAVTLTRQEDTYLSLEERTQKAEKSKGDIFVSIHLNNALQPGVRGVETFALSMPGYKSSNDAPSDKPSEEIFPGNEFNGANMVLAYSIHKAMTHASSLPDRGIKRARFKVLRTAPCPAVLIECGFLSNQKDAALFNKQNYLHYIAQRLSNGIHEFFKN